MKARHGNTILYLTFIVILLGTGCSKDTDLPEYYIGKEFGGGIVFDVSADGHHGLIAETIDQGRSTFYGAGNLARNGIHSEAGKAFTDWRVPTIDELNQLYQQRDIVGGFMSAYYWSSTWTGDIYFFPIMYLRQSFYTGLQGSGPPNSEYLVRAVRDF